MVKKKVLVLGSLKLQAVNTLELREFTRIMEGKTFEKIKEDVKRDQRNAERARKFVAR